LRLYGIRPWEMDGFTPDEIRQIGEDIKQMNRSNN
jgi:hypothetical protein